jgi:hypothetical protein
MLTIKFVIVSTIIYVLSMMIAIVIINPNLINYVIIIISLVYLTSILSKILEIHTYNYVENVTIKEPRSRLEYLQSLVKQTDKGKNNIAFMLLTEEIRSIGAEIIAMYLKISVIELKSIPLEELTKIVNPVTAKVIKGESQIHNKQELIVIINDLKNILKMI